MVMSINIVKQEKDFVEIEYDGDVHTVLNLLKRELLDNKDVVFAGYTRPHPLEAKGKLVVRTKGSEAMKAVKSAVSSVQKNIKSLAVK